MATILENCQVRPLPGSYEDLSLPLTHFDIQFLLSDPTERLFFFELRPCSKSQFLETIVPQLKKSLSLTLAHFLALAGNIVLPFKSGWPVIRYVPGDSVSLTIAECDKDFDHLTGNHQRLADDFYACTPQLPQADNFIESVAIPAIAFQITVFPGQGICVGLSNHHAVADESSIINFMKAWAAVNKSGGDDHSIGETYCRSFDRAVAQDPDGLDSQAWSLMKGSRAFPIRPTPLSVPTNKVRATFIMTKNHVQNLKNYVLAKRPNIRHVSSFTVIAAYVLACSEKSSSTAAEEANDNEMIYFACSVECRARLVPPLPSLYFGNCLVFLTTELMPTLLKGNDGFLTAAESIGEAIHKTVHGEKGTILDRADLPLNIQKYGGKRIISVAGSPRVHVYDVDFGWGRPKKYEFVQINNESSMSLCSSRDYEGGFEIGLSRTKVEMDMFESLFNSHLA